MSKAIERAQKAKNKLKRDIVKNPEIITKEDQNITTEISEQLQTNPEFSLEVDPLNKYGMGNSQKEFIKHYVDFKSIPLAAELCGIDAETAKAYFVSYASQQEIRRINRAMYQRQFCNKLLSLDDIGGYLSSLITDENVPLADRLKTTDKLRVAGMIIDLHKYKNEAVQNPSMIINQDIETDIKALSVDTIKELLHQKKKEEKQTKTKEELITEVKGSQDLTIEEEAFLKTLDYKELLDLIDLDKSKNKEEK